MLICSLNQFFQSDRILACFMPVSTMHELYMNTENPEESGFSPQVLGDGADGC